MSTSKPVGVNERFGEMENGEMENGEMVNSPASGEDVSNGDMRPARAPGMPKIKHANIHALEQFIIRQCLKMSQTSF